MSKDGQRQATIAARAAGAVDTATAGIVPGIHPATTFLRDAEYALEVERNSYARDHNDTVRAAEEVLRHLEGAADTLLFPSGMAAAAAVLRTVRDGGRIVLQSGIYHGVTTFSEAFAARRGITLDRIDASDPEVLTAACARSADLVWIEAPSNPWLKITDIAQAAALAHGAGAKLVVDGTAASPVLTQALAFGADISMHSTTKAINGHSDVVGGVLSCRDAESDLWADIKTDRLQAGAIMGPFEAWLTLRGVRTLPLRMERMSANAQALAEFLDAHAAVEQVLYPGLSDHPGHALAKRQMCGGFGYLMSFIVKGGAEGALRAAGRLKLIHRATSLGGVESLIEHRPTIEPQSGLPGGMLRFSVGIEDVEDLKGDLAQALEG